MIGYLSCALTGAGQSYHESCALYEAVRDYIHQNVPDCTLILPHLIDPSTGLQLEDGSANYQAAGLDSKIVFECDLDLIKSSDFILAWLDHPSHGAGSEITIALMMGLPVIAVVRRPLSKFLSGLLDSFDCVKITTPDVGKAIALACREIRKLT